MSTRRLFLGLELPELWAHALAAHARSTLGAVAGLTLHPARDLHLTLAFLGSFPEDRRAALESTLAARVRGAPAPLLVPGGTGAFPHRRRPRILWAGVSGSRPGLAGLEGLEGLRERVWTAAMEHGWRPTRAERERPFRPHVTLARVRRVGPGAGFAPFYVESPQEFAGDSAAESSAEAASLAPWSVGQVAVFESRPDRPQERYRVLSRAPL